LDNLEKLAGICRPKILPRIPLIPRMTATESNLLAAAAFLEKLGFKNAVLLHYNPLWHDKADAVGRKAADLPRHFMPVDEVGRLEKAFYDALR
jgi:pyruvate-formate lyase-activating enzyme